MTERMRILTVKQPWAWALISGGKDVENRTRSLAGDWTGPIAIHVALHEDNNAFSRDELSSSMHLNVAADEWQYDQIIRKDVMDSQPWHQHHGHIIGVVDLLDSHGGNGIYEAHPCSPWAEDGRFHLVLANPRPLNMAIPYRGGQGLRWLPDDVAAEVMHRAAVGGGERA